MLATFRCGHTKEFNHQRFHEYQIPNILISYGAKDCPACRRLGTAGDTSSAPKSPPRQALDGYPLTDVEKRLIEALEKPLGPAEYDDIFDPKPATSSAGGASGVASDILSERHT